MRVGQKTLDRDRQAIQYLLTRTTSTNVRLPRIESTYTGGRHLAQQSRAYTKDQVEFICSKMSARSALATRVAYAAGLRGHELYTLRRRPERAPSVHRKWSKERFLGRSGIVYTVKGKGGLVREVLISTQLANELEMRRLPEPVTLRNRGINHQQHYDITAGQSFSHIFTKASVKYLGWSTGAHGLRHGYAQVRMDELHTGRFTRPGTNGNRQPGTRTLPSRYRQGLSSIGTVQRYAISRMINSSSGLLHSIAEAVAV